MESSHTDYTLTFGGIWSVESHSFELAGMMGPEGGRDILAGSLAFEQLTVPKHINLAGDYLYWWDDLEYERDRVDVTDAVLNAFVRIETPDHILRFARQYGPLGLCKHGLPPRHRGTWYRDIITNGQLSGVEFTGEWNPVGGGSERGWCPPCGSEHIARWSYYQRIALTCLTFAAEMKVKPDKITVPAKYLKRIGSTHPGHIGNGIEMPVRGLGKFIISDMINEWLGDAGVALELNWTGNEPRLILTGGRAFGALGVQLLLAVTANNLAVCDGCKLPYLREGRKPQKGRRNFCRTCGKKAAWKMQARDFRAGKSKPRAKRKGATQ